MKISRMLCAAMAAALAAGTMTVTVFAGRDSIPAEELENYFSDGNHTIGITGGFTEWGAQPDIPMTDPDGDGVYIGVICGLGEGAYEFKVRSDKSWDDSWGAYDENEDKTFNSQINCALEVSDRADVYVTLDTNGSDCVAWPVKFFSTEEMEPSKYGITGNMLNWGDEPDAPMYEIMPGKFFGVLKEVPAGEQQFKVRADNAWDESYGVYEPDYDRTNNSQTNCSTTIPDSGEIIVELDTTGEDNITWPVSFTAIDSNNNAFDVRYTGKEIETPSKPETSETSDVSEVSDEPLQSDDEESEQELSEDSIIEISAESEAEDSEEIIKTSAEAAVSDVSKEGGSAPADNTTAGDRTAAASAVSDAPSTGEAVMAIIFLSIITAALGVIVLSVKRSNETK